MKKWLKIQSRGFFVEKISRSTRLGVLEKPNEVRRMAKRHDVSLSANRLPFLSSHGETFSLLIARDTSNQFEMKILFPSSAR